MTPPSIEFFIGAPVEYASERAVLEKVHGLAIAAGCNAIIFANFTVDGRQIDALVATDEGVLLIEAKGAAHLLEGDVNGRWRMQTAAGQIFARNGYQQAIRAKNALRDAMAAISASAPYADAAVVLVPRVPTGSKLTPGDYKARVVGLDHVVLPKRRLEPVWSLAEWRDFAKRYHLHSVQSLSALIDPKVLGAEIVLDAYSRAFEGTYGERARQLIGFPCNRSDGTVLGADELPKVLASEPGLTLLGPSGCGKSLAGLSLAFSQLAAGDIPVVVEAKHFDGQLGASLDREASLLGVASFRAINAACGQTGRRLLFVVDGFNECRPDLKFTLTRGLAALARRTGGKLLVSTQAEIEGNLLMMQIVHVPCPELELKVAIAQGARQTAPRPEIISLLDAVGSGLEARMLGEVGDEVMPGASRFALFDLYVRHRLGKQGSAGIQTLSAVAGRLAEQLTFSMSIRDFDRLRANEGQEARVADELLGAGFLERRGDRLSFGHELYLLAFQAEALVRGAKGDAAKIAAELRNPISAPLGTLVLGAVDGGPLLKAVLEDSADTGLILRCLEGESGEAARILAEEACARVFKAGRAEIDGASFELDSGAWLGVQPSKINLRPWTLSERAVLAALPEWLNRTSRLHEILGAAREVDGKLRSEFIRLKSEAQERKVALRSGLFAQIYVYEGVGLSRAFGANAGFRRWSGPAEDLAKILTARADELTAGEVYILLGHARDVPRVFRQIAAAVSRLLRRMWQSAPYHLKIALLEAAGSCYEADEDDKQAVIQALEGVGPSDHIMLSTLWVESMEHLGALEGDTQSELERLRAEIPSMLESPEDAGQRQAAWGLYYRRFDHPLASAYCTAFDELTPDMESRVLSMAAHAADLDTFFAGPLIVDLAAAGDAVQARPITRWTVLPSPVAIAPQEAFANYLLAHMALARHGLGLPGQPAPVGAAGRALAACGEVMYFANRLDLSATELEARLSAAWERLISESGAAIVVLRECSRLREETFRRLPGHGIEPSQILIGREVIAVQLARSALEDPSGLVDWFHPEFFKPDDSQCFALELLGKWGDIGDLDRLRASAGVPNLAKTAISEIRRLEDRLFKSDGAR